MLLYLLQLQGEASIPDARVKVLRMQGKNARTSLHSISLESILLQIMYKICIWDMKETHNWNFVKTSQSTKNLAAFINYHALKMDWKFW